MILIDTSAFIEFLNHTISPFDKELEHLISNEEDLALADIIITEILQGIKDDKEFNEIKKSLMAFPIYSLKGVDSYIAAAELYRRCRKKGLTVRSTIDLLIAQMGQCQVFSVNSHQGFILNGFHESDYAAIL